MMHRCVTKSSVLATRTAVRQFRQGRPTRITENKPLSGVSGLVVADNANWTTKASHLSSVALAVLVPTAFVLSPSALNMPVDLAIGVLIPVHAHIGVNAVISDYIPKNMQMAARFGVLSFTGLMLLGLLRLNVEGPGITESIKEIWRDPKRDLTRQK